MAIKFPQHRLKLMDRKVDRNPDVVSNQGVGETEGNLDFWPPWPFNMIGDSESKRPQNGSSAPAGNRQPKTVMSTAFSVSKKSFRIAVRNFQELGSQLWFHLPPAAPPLLVLAAAWPREEAAKRKLPILLQNRFCRQCAATGIALAMLSWGHTHWYRKRKLTPIIPEMEVKTAVLPPFLPAAVPLDLLVVENDGEDDDDGTKRPAGIDFVPPRLRRYWKHAIDDEETPDQMNTCQSLRHWISTWQRSWSLQRAERNKARRLAIYDELVAIQRIQKKQNNEPLRAGYAIVTGASQGIGRAIAVELARWKIPLILVARNTQALQDLATDLETCYGVPCFILGADLSKPDAAANIYKSIRRAELPVDILVNNAGVATHGNTLDQSMEQINQMVQVNTLSLLTLTHLFGRDMKEQRRGRILMVSSVCGAVNGIATVAVYSATKAFENSFGVALGKEMEPYGVGVTCLIPGAVRGTEFRERSQSAQALCWKVPFYAKSAPTVAECGVRSLLLGETQVTPGVLNRVFLKVVQPVCPQRLHNLIAEILWNPVKLPWRKSKSVEEDSESHLIGQEHSQSKHTFSPSYSQGGPSAPINPSDRFLKLPEQDKELVAQPEYDDKIDHSNSFSTSPDTTKDNSSLSSTIPQSIENSNVSVSIDPQSFRDTEATLNIKPNQASSSTDEVSSGTERPLTETQADGEISPAIPDTAIPKAPDEHPPHPAPSRSVEPEKSSINSSLEILLNRYQSGRLSPWGDPMAPYYGEG